MTKFSVGLLVVGLFAVSPSVAGLIWQDLSEDQGDFSSWSGATGNWSVVMSPQSAHAGVRGIDIVGATGAGGDTLTKTISTTDYEQLFLTYWFKVRESLEATDNLWLQWTADGAMWNNFLIYTDLPASDWQFAVIAFPLEASWNPNFGFRFIANFGSGSDRMNFDEVELWGMPVPEPASAVLLGASLLLARRRS